MYFNSQSYNSKNKLTGDHTAIYKSSFKRSRASLKSSIQKRLLIRLLIAGTLISIALASTVFFLEFHRLGRLVNGRAGEIAARFNDEIRDQLDDPTLPGKPALQNKLKMLSIIGKLNLGLGHVIYAGIYNLEGNAIVIEKDAQCTYMNEVDDVMNSQEQRLPTDFNKVHKIRHIHGTPHIQLTFPLTNNHGEQAAILSGIFAVSSDARDDVVGRIVRTAFETIGIVLLTTLILYPIIITLISQLSKLADSLLEANIETLQVLGSAIAKRDSDTDIHNYRVTIYSVTLAEAFGLRHSLIQALIKGAFLHDVGKIGVSDQILLKPGKLTENEFEIMKRHVNHGIDIVERSDWLRDATDVVGYHHEQYTGGGYPYGLKGELIPITARIFAIADVFDALTSSRPYKDPMPFEDAMAILEGGRSTHFDPSLLDTFNTIAKALYEKVATCSDETLRENLKSITRQYFSKEMYSS
jgi:HD-GYP domain-containing protein (c-di-GMP phosphodiesterase class II)